MKTLAYPFSEADVRGLKVGDTMSVSGRVFTGRDRLHKYLFEGGACPVDLKDGALYHCGPVVVQREGEWIVKAAGPTTSMREEPFMPRIIADHGVRVIIGKGGMSEGTRRACREHGCVYLHAVGGAAALLAQSVKRVCNVFFRREFGAAEAVWELEVDGLAGLVTMDAHGRSLHKRIGNASRRALKELLAETH
jgi:fumarate hydratase subunit beta